METILEAGRKIKLSQQNLTEEEITTCSAEIPLSTLKSGDSGTVQRLEGGEEFRSKMLALGIIPGKAITIARGEKHQPYVLRVDESRVMVDWRTLDRIYVQPGIDFRRKGGFLR